MNQTASSEPLPQAPLPLPLPTFDALPLTPEVRRAIDEIGWVNPTPVQLAAWEPALKSQDLIVQARTGTGKTAAFALPLVDRRVANEPVVQALILAPTRELSLQSAREFERLGKYRGIRTTAIYGGASMEKQVRELEEGAQVVSGTPGRVLDHLKRGTLKVEHLRTLILDEADEMLSMGFAKELNAIVELLPKNRQTWLFSATIDDQVQRMANRILKEPATISLSSDEVGAQTLKHFVYVITGGTKSRDLVRILEVETPRARSSSATPRSDTERSPRSCRPLASTPTG
jgi:ATP-dependent RNA helicase DeaD